MAVRCTTEVYEFDVFTAHHDDMKGGGEYKEVWSRVVISSEEFPHWAVAAQVAANMAIGIHGGMATRVLPRY